MRASLNGETPSVSNIQANITNTFRSITSSSKCGDGVCDIYSGENNTTCPQDCN